MDQSEFILAMTAIMMGGGIVITIITTVAKLASRRHEPSALASGAVAQIDERLAPSLCFARAHAGSRTARHPDDRSPSA